MIKKTFRVLPAAGRALLAAVAVLAVSCSAFAAPTAPGKRPNVLVILVDDMGAKELGCYGNAQHKTPHLDALAKGGTRFQTAYATPVCTPSRVMLLTGRYAFRTGWYSFIGHRFSPRPGTPQYDLGALEVTFADVLKARGYKTALAGKWQLPGQLPTLIHDNGFDEYCMWAYSSNLPPGVEHTGRYEVPGKTARFWHPSIVKNGKYVPTTDKDYGPDLFADFLIEFMTRHKDGPFLAYYPMVLTHNPQEPTPDLKNPGQKTPGSFRHSVEYMDHTVGRLVGALERLGIRQDTVVLFTSDNGTGGDGKGRATELGARVPLIASCPGTVTAGVVSGELVSLADVLPTLAELAGAALPRDRAIDGRSFAPILRGEKGEPRPWLFSYVSDRRVLRDKRWLLEEGGKFFDCGENRDHRGYKEVTGSQEPEVVAARRRFEQILKDLPAPASPRAGEPRVGEKRNRENKRPRQRQAPG